MIADVPPSAALLASPLLRGIPPARLGAIAELFERKSYPAQTPIVREGDPGDALYIVESGLVEIFMLSATGAITVVSRLGSGEAFGEMSVLTGEPRSASVRTVGETVVRVIPRDRFLQAAAETPILLFNLSRVLVTRLNSANQAAASVRTPEIVAIIGRVPPLVGSLVATNLAAALSWTTRQRVMLVDRPGDQASWLPGRDRMPPLAELWSRSGGRMRVPALQFGASRFMAVSMPEDGSLLDATGPLSLSEALGWFRQNARYTVLNLAGAPRSHLAAILPFLDRNYLLITTAQLSTSFADEVVSAFAAQRSDVREHSFPVVLSDEGLSLPAVRARSVERLGVPPRVILPGPAQILRDAARHRPPLAVEARHLSFSRAMYWLARDVARLKVGVALGAGGARGFAHVGALQFFEEHDIPNDYLAGTSMGSVIGAPRALGMDIAQGREIMLRLHQKFTNLLQPHWALMTSLFAAKGVEDTYRELVGNATFEELAVPFTVVAADLETARPVAFTQGSVADALRASSSIPGVWPPKVIGKMRLVDGAALNPVPTQPVRDLGADIVIAVDLSATGDPMVGEGGPLRQTNVVQDVLRCINIMTAERAVRDCLLADVVIRPVFAVTGWKHFDKADVYAEAGYKAATEALPALRKLLPWLEHGRDQDA